MDVVVSSRHCEVSERFREHVEEKLARLEKHDHRIIRVEVLLEREARPRDPERTVRVELTAKSRGPIVRAEASAEDKMAALDLALDKMAAQMRRAADRARCIAASTSPSRSARRWPAARRPGRATVMEEVNIAERKVGPVTVTGDGPLVVREKSPRGRSDDPRAGALRDGAGGPRLLPVRGQGERTALGGLPPSRL